MFAILLFRGLCLSNLLRIGLSVGGFRSNLGAWVYPEFLISVDLVWMIVCWFLDVAVFRKIEIRVPDYGWWVGCFGVSWEGDGFYIDIVLFSGVPE